VDSIVLDVGEETVGEKNTERRPLARVRGNNFPRLSLDYCFDYALRALRLIKRTREDIQVIKVPQLKGGQCNV
jgi:hypothetical protein